jgi:hypothetical protein
MTADTPTADAVEGSTVKVGSTKDPRRYAPRVPARNRPRNSEVTWRARVGLIAWFAAGLAAGVSLWFVSVIVLALFGFLFAAVVYGIALELIVWVTGTARPVSSCR